MLNSLYTYTKESETVFKVHLNRDNIIFKVHFEGNPVLPGACMVEITRKLMETITGRPLYIIKIKNLKFANMVTPVNNPDILFHFDISNCKDDTTESKVQITDTENKQLFAKLSLSLKDVA